MNTWTEQSIELANQRNYLDLLYSVYPSVSNVVRDIDANKWAAVEKAFEAKDNVALVKAFLAFDLFPIKDSYVAYLRRDATAIERNPQTINRLAGQLREMGLDKLWEKTSEPKETNRQMGGVFSNWLKKGVLGAPIQTETEFLSHQENAIFEGGDAALKKFAEKHLNYQHNKGLDFLARFNGKYVIGEAKFLTDIGGNQNNQMETTLSTLKQTGVKATIIGILDGVIYIKNKGKLHKQLKEASKNNPIMSALLLRDFLYQL